LVAFLAQRELLDHLLELREALRFCLRLRAAVGAQHLGQALKTAQVQPLVGLLAVVTVAHAPIPPQRSVAAAVGQVVILETVGTVVVEQALAALTALAVAAAGAVVVVTAMRRVPAGASARLVLGQTV
jgi:hypothetical protein